MVLNQVLVPWRAGGPPLLVHVRPCCSTGDDVDRGEQLAIPPAPSTLPFPGDKALAVRLSLRRVFLVSLNSQPSGWPSATQRRHGWRLSASSGTQRDLRRLHGSHDWYARRRLSSGGEPGWLTGRNWRGGAEGVCAGAGAG